MKQILLFMLILSLVFGKGLICFIPVQSLFFALALKKHSESSVFIKGTVLIFCGLSVSLILLFFSVKDVTEFLYYCLISITVHSLYLCFFGIILLMIHLQNNKNQLKPVILLCAIIPCFAIIPQKIEIPLSIPATLLFIDSIILYTNLVLLRRKQQRHKDNLQ